MTAASLQFRFALDEPVTPASLVNNAKSALKAGQPLPDIYVATITPELAQQLLEFKLPHNRKISKVFLKRYAKLMKEGRWGLSILSFSDDHFLIDGQHRLSAVVEAQIPVDFYIATGLSIEATPNFDRCRRRTPTHVCQVAGKPWVSDKHTGTAKYMNARLITNQAGKLLWQAPLLEAEQVVEILDKYGEGVKAVVEAVGGWNDGLSLATVLSVIAKAYYVRPNERDRILHFCHCYRDGQNKQSDADNAAILLSNTIKGFLAQRKQSMGTNWSTELHSQCISVTQIALKFFLEKKDTSGKSGKKINLLRFTPDKDLFSLPAMELICNKVA